jgi:hypothetical protein
MTPEGKVKQMIKRHLKEYGVWYDMPVPGGYGKPTLDFLCCYKGRFFAIEAKAEGKKPTPRQHRTMVEIVTAGGMAFVVDSEYRMQEVLAWMKLIGES